MACFPPGQEEAGESGQGPTRPDLRRKVLEAPRSDPTTVQIHPLGRICLKDGDGNPFRRSGPVSFQRDQLLLADPEEGTLRLFLPDGSLARNVPLPTSLATTSGHGYFDVLLADASEIWLARPPRGLFILHWGNSSLAFRNLSENPSLRGAYALTRGWDGSILVSLLPFPSPASPRGPLLALFRNGELVTTFYWDRTRPRSPQEDFRPNLLPIVFADTDRAGNIYTCERVDYELRKYDATGRYLGDFSVQPDHHYLPPPDAVDKERLKIDDAFRADWYASWTQILGLFVLGEHCLVVQFEVHTAEATRYRLHFYRLDGGVAHPPLWWDYQLVARGEEEVVYSLDQRDDSFCFFKHVLLH